MIQSKKITASTQNQYVMIEEERFFLTDIDQKTYMVPDKCPHRGGPLSLGKPCEKTGGIQCPWHDNVIKPATLIKKSIPAIRINNDIFYV